MQQQLENYLRNNHLTNLDLKAILFDMDGVLYDSMPAHAESWQKTMEEFGYKSTEPVEFYLHEGRLGKSTIDLITEREFNRSATKKEEGLSIRKSELFQQLNKMDFTRCKRGSCFVTNQG